MTPTKQADIRLALESDEEDLVDLLREMHAESGFGAFSEPKARLAIEIGLRREMAIIGVIRGRSQIEGSIGLFVQPAPGFSTEPILSDLWNFVREPWRKSTRAKDLVTFGKWAATQLDKPLLVTAMSNEKTQRKVELLQRQLPAAGQLFYFQPEAA